MNNRLKFLPALLVACFLTSQLGCAAANRTPPTTPNTTTQQTTGLTQGTPNAVAPGTGTAYTTTNTGTLPGNNIANVVPGTIKAPVPVRPTAFDVKKADNIARQIGTVSGAKKISVVVKGNTALVAYTPTGKTKSTLATKNAIVKKVKTADRSITNVVVSESAAAMKKVNRLANDVKLNATGNGLTVKFDRLVKSIKSTGK